MLDNAKLQKPTFYWKHLKQFRATPQKKLLQRVATETNNPQLFEVATKISSADINFLVGTGDPVTILPHELTHGLNLHSTPVHLSANEEEIKCYREASVDISIPGLTPYIHVN